MGTSRNCSKKYSKKCPKTRTFKNNNKKTTTKSKKSRKSKKINRKSKHLNLYKIEYPYYKHTVSKQDIIQHFKQLRKYKPKILKRNPIRKPINKINNEYVVFVEDYNKNKDMCNITDYFTQTCRVKCVYNAKEKKSILELFKENRDIILSQLEKENKMTHYDLSEYLYSHYKMCTNFNTTLVVSILRYFKPDKYLDLSAGWGDRLIGAIAYGCKYTGVDPSECMNPNYHKIIKALVPEKKRGNYQIIKSGFETAELPENEYDLMFSSPPFFTLEIYENTKNQSVEKFNTLKKWEEGFLYPSIQKVYKSLKVGGHMALYISDYTETHYTENMKKYIKQNVPNFKYVGDLNWWNVDKKYVVRTVFVWKKIE